MLIIILIFVGDATADFTFVDKNSILIVFIII